MNVVLSQRAGRAMSTEVFATLSPQQRQDFITAVENATTFQSLASDAKKLLLAAEATYAKGDSKT